MTGHDDDELMTRLLAQALEVEARRNPLPVDFAASITDGLADRPRRGLLSLAALPALAGTLVLAFAGVAVVLSFWRPAVSGPPGSSGLVSSGSPAPPLAHYSADGISFDYPADWRLIEQGIHARHYQWIPVVLGTGDWELNCQPIQPSGDIVSGITCGADIFTIGRGEIVLEIYTSQGPSQSIQTPPPAATSLPTGWRATVAEASTSSTWQIYLPGWVQPLTVDAHFADPGAEDMRAEVRRFVESLVVSPTLIASPEQTNPPPAP